MKHLAAALFAAVLVMLGGISPAVAQTERWTPAPGAPWQWQLDSVPTTAELDGAADAKAFDIDGFETPASKVAEIKARGAGAVCYISVGSWENYRPDAARFPAVVKGRNVSGWQGEKWLDIRRLDILGPIMAARMQMCKDKGFDAVEPDLQDGYTNRTGFPLTATDQLTYNRWVADTAHGLGLSAILKGDPEQAVELEPSFDFALNEECFQYAECGAYTAFTGKGKTVWQVEYKNVANYCTKAKAAGFAAMRKNLDLDAWRQPCV